MPLKLKLKSKDEIPAEVQSLYVEREGTWVLDVEGAADAVQLRANWRMNGPLKAKRIYSDRSWTLWRCSQKEARRAQCTARFPRAP